MIRSPGRRGGDWHLETGDVVRLGERYTGMGTRAPEGPQQIVTRGYGCALTSTDVTCSVNSFYSRGRALDL